MGQEAHEVAEAQTAYAPKEESGAERGEDDHGGDGVETLSGGARQGVVDGDSHDAEDGGGNVLVAANNAGREVSSAMTRLPTTALARAMPMPRGT